MTLSLLVVAAILFSFPGYLFLTGQLYYFYQLGLGNYRIMSARVPIAHILDKPATAVPNDTTKLQMALEVREFASRSLGLPKNKSYTLFSNIHREFLGWNVYATAKHSVEPEKWCFPIAGCIVYRGYFSLNDAKDFASASENADKDIFIGPITAYSTLGHFNDPILSTHLKLEDFRLASMVIHELAHQRLYFPGKSDVNEAFAVVVEREGLMRWLRDSGRGSWTDRVQTSWNEEDRKVRLILDTRAKLAAEYASNNSFSEMDERKKALFSQLEADLCISRCSGDDLPKATHQTFIFNNAYLTPVNTYYGKYDELHAILDEVGGDLVKFYNEVEKRYK